MLMKEKYTIFEKNIPGINQLQVYKWNVLFGYFY